MFASLPDVNGPDALISSLAASVILGFREFVQPILYRKTKVIVPIEFLVLVIATSTSYIFDFKSRFGVRIVGSIPERYVIEL
jgi:MFS superfamily sulfate permease-like transporter